MYLLAASLLHAMPDVCVMSVFIGIAITSTQSADVTRLALHRRTSSEVTQVVVSTRIQMAAASTAVLANFLVELPMDSGIMVAVSITRSLKPDISATALTAMSVVLAYMPTVIGLSQKKLQETGYMCHSRY
jgi:hypothetical protein